jgi:signal transduction histidine kinase
MGMGLLLVKRVVESYGGKVSIQSRLGEGTTFSFTFPALDG